MDDPDTRPCPDGPICRYRLGDADMGVCAAACRPGEACGRDAGCGISSALPYPICVATGPASAGEDCSGNRCTEGLACLEVPDSETPAAFVERCTRLCDPSGAGDPMCPSGACDGLILGVDGIGYCTDDS